MPLLLVPDSLARLFPGMPRSIPVAGAGVASCIADAETRWPGLQDRLLATPGTLRQHILVFVDGLPASPMTAVRAESEILVVPALSGG